MRRTIDYDAVADMCHHEDPDQWREIALRIFIRLSDELLHLSTEAEDEGDDGLSHVADRLSLDAENCRKRLLRSEVMA